MKISRSPFCARSQCLPAGSQGLYLATGGENTLLWQRREVGSSGEGCLGQVALTGSPTDVGMFL